MSPTRNPNNRPCLCQGHFVAGEDAAQATAFLGERKWPLTRSGHWGHGLRRDLTTPRPGKSAIEVWTQRTAKATATSPG